MNKHTINFFHTSLEHDYDWEINQYPSNSEKQVTNKDVKNFSFNGGDLWIRGKIDYVKDVLNCISIICETSNKNKNLNNINIKESRFSITYSFPDPNLFADYIEKKYEPEPNYLGIKTKDFKYFFPRSPYCYYDLIPFIYRKNTLFIDWIFLKYFLRQHEIYDLFKEFLKIYRNIKEVHIKENESLKNQTRMKKFLSKEPHWAESNAECGGVNLRNIFADKSFEAYAKKYLKIQSPNKKSISPVDYLNADSHLDFNLETPQMNSKDKNNIKKFKLIFNKNVKFVFDEHILRNIYEG